ncbi:putative E3 ubiquitin-protein ligase WAVH2 [Senna tora]|uniref:Putative E3 ubiquitin-protein ligase WAVH2 n=1 Tax=Senna tora TaxID=362788 RepID=A0A834SDC2_9FABA|nr:putative E3 ubiquitin-protein ligase WAVH2 [Senna tora]
MVEAAAARRRPSSSRLREAARKLQALAAAAYACASFSRTKPLVDPSSSISNSSSASPSTSLTSSGQAIEERDCSIAIKNNDNENSTKLCSVIRTFILILRIAFWDTSESNESQRLTLLGDIFLFVCLFLSDVVLQELNMCAICLDPLSYNSKGTSNPGQAIFTAQCSHAFHFACISSNVRHGSVTCPICRAHWTQLPRNLNKSFCGSSTPCTQTDPILQILDDSIATFRVHRRSLLHSVRYDNDDPIEPDNSPDSPTLCFSLVPLPPNALSSNYPAFHMTKHTPSPCHPSSAYSSSSLSHSPYYITSPSSKRAYISVKQSRVRAMDFVLVVSTNGPHLRLLKQAMALVVFSLRNIDRLAIVTYTLPASSPRVFPLRRMTSYGKRTALLLIDRINYMRQADPIEGLKKGIKILEDRMHRNPESRILHLSANPTIIPYHTFSLEDLPPTPIHQFHVGFGFGASNGFIIHEFEEFLGKMLMGGNVGEIQLRIRTEEDGIGRVIWIGELRGEERIVLEVGDCKHVHLEYSYVEVEGGGDECVIRNGEIVLGVGDHRDDGEGFIGEEAHVERRSGIMNSGGALGGCRGGGDGGRPNCVGSWDFHDPYMARRWAKYLHGYRL